MIRQKTGHARYNSYPQTILLQGTTYPENLTQYHTTTASVTSHIVPPENSNHMNYATTTTNPAYTSTQQAYGDANRFYDTHHTQRMATSDHTQYVGTSKYHDQSTSYTYGGYSGVQNGYQPPVTTPVYALCTVGRNSYVLDLSFLK